MKIVHICVAGAFTDGMAYQENELVNQHVVLGHEVTVIASTEVFGPTKQIIKTEAGVSRLVCGATIHRLPYAWGLNGWLATKIRAHRGLHELLVAICPDRILFHSLTGWELLTVAAYVRRNPKVTLFADSHEDWNNSATSFLSKWILHYFFYRVILWHSLPTIRRVLCVSLESIDFVRDFYSVPRGKIEFFPLGGVLWEDAAYNSMRVSTRDEQGWSKENRVFLQSGKIDRAKRLVNTLKVFANLKDKNLRLVITGEVMSDVRENVFRLIDADSRVQMLGWVDAQRLRALLCAVDVYVQPGSQSATMQMALCCRCPVVLSDAPSHHVFVQGNGFLVKSDADLATGLTSMSTLPDKDLRKMSLLSSTIAARFLDYRQQALRVLES